MLNEIYKTLKSHQGEELSADDTNPIDREFGIKFGIKFGINDKQILLSLCTMGSGPLCIRAGQDKGKYRKLE